MAREHSGTRVFLPHEVIHVKYYNPYEPLRGLAPWEAAQQDARQDFEKRIIARVLERENGNLSRAAKVLRIHRNTLSKKIIDYKIKRR